MKKDKKTIQVKKEVFFDSNGIFPYISKAPTVGISESKLNVEVLLQDTKEKEFEARLVTFSRFEGIIPEIMSYHAEGVGSAICEEILKERLDLDPLPELAYYLYQKI